MLFNKELHTKEYLEGVIAIKGSKQAACDYLEITRTTMYDWLKKAKSYKSCIYFLQVNDTSIYIGCTNNISKRMKAHIKGTTSGSKYVFQRQPFNVLYTQQVNDLKEGYQEEGLLQTKTNLEIQKYLKQKGVEIELWPILVSLELSIKTILNNRRKLERYTKSRISTANQFLEWIRDNPGHIYHDYFVSRMLTHPSKPDRSVIEKVFAVLRDADKR